MRMESDCDERPGSAEPGASDTVASKRRNDRAPVLKTIPGCEDYLRGLECALDEWSSDADEAAWRDL